MKFERASKKQVYAARQFAAAFGVSVSQAMKYLDELFQYQRGEITAQEFVSRTGWEIDHPVSRQAGSRQLRFL